MTGDIMMGTTFPSTQLPPNDGRDIFMDTKAITSRANLAVGNLEGTVPTATPSAHPPSSARASPRRATIS